IILDDRSEPEPDIAVIRGSPRDYVDAHPTRPALVVEVAQSGLRLARGRKAAAYARGRIADYWIVNLIDRVLEARREPVRLGPARRHWGYAAIETLAADATVTPLAARSASIPVRDLLPQSSATRDCRQRLFEAGRQLADDRLEREHLVDLSSQRWPRGEGDVFQMPALPDRDGRPVVDQGLRTGAIGVAREHASKALGEHEALERFEIDRHPLGIHDEISGDPLEGVERAAGRVDQLGDRHQLGLPATERALVLGNCAGDQRRHQTGRAFGGSQRLKTGDGVALVGHGARSTHAFRWRRLQHLA